jgi:hypothetical protein
VSCLCWSAVCWLQNIRLANSLTLLGLVHSIEISAVFYLFERLAKDLNRPQNDVDVDVNPRNNETFFGWRELIGSPMCHHLVTKHCFAGNLNRMKDGATSIITKWNMKVFLAIFQFLAFMF